MMPTMTQLQGLSAGGYQQSQLYGSGAPSPQQVMPQQAAAQQSYGMLLMQQQQVQQQAQQREWQQQLAAGGRRGGGGGGSFGGGMPQHTMGHPGGGSAGAGVGVGSPADIGSLGASLAAMQLGGGGGGGGASQMLMLGGGGGVGYGSPMGLPPMPGGGQQQGYPGNASGFGAGPASFMSGGGYYSQQRPATGPRGGQQWQEQQEGPSS